MSGSSGGSYGILSVRRSTSPIFNKLPLLTNILLSGTDEDVEALKDNWPDYNALISRFFDYERRLLGVHGYHTLSRDMRALLAVDIISDGGKSVLIPSTSPQSSFNAGQYGKLCSFLTLYRLVDIMAWLKDIGGKASLVGRAANVCPADSLPGYNDLRDWPQKALEFRELLNGSAMSDGEPTDGRGQTSRLLRFLSSNSKDLRRNTVVANLVAAATHLSYLKEFCRDSDKFPDLPDQINDQVIRDASSDEERKFLTDLQAFMLPLTSSHHRTKSGGVSLASFRSALQAAALISSAYLSSSTLFPKKSWNKSSLLQTAQLLGNDKPVELLEAEKVFWDVIFKLSCGSLHPNEALPALKKNLPWSMIESVADRQSWFDLPGGMEVDTLQRVSLDDVPSASLSSPPSSRQSDDTPPIEMSKDVEASTTALATPDPANDPPASHTLKESAANSRDAPEGDSSVADNLQSNETLLPMQGVEALGVPLVPDPSQAVRTEEDDVRSTGQEQGSPSPAIQPTPPLGEASPIVDPVMDKNGTVLLDASSSPLTSENDDAASGPADADSSPSKRRSGRLGKKSPVDTTSKATSPSPSTGKGSSGPGKGSSSSTTKKKRKRTNMAKLVPKPALADSSRSSSSTPSNPTFRKPRGSTAVGSRFNPIDVDFFNMASPWEPDNLDALRQVTDDSAVDTFSGDAQPLERSSGRIKFLGSYTVFDGDGNKIQLRPEFHYEDYIVRFCEILNGVTESYINDLPLFIAKPEASVIRVLTYEEYSSLSPAQLHGYLAKQNIVVRGFPVPDHQFDEKGLNAIHPLDNTVPLQDYSLQGNVKLRSDEGNALKKSKAHKRTASDTVYFDSFDRAEKHIPATVNGTLRLLLEEVRAGDKGRTLNGLDLPLPHESTAPTAYSTDRHAFHNTRGRPGFPSSETFPTTDMCWALGGGPNTITFVHIDSDGFNTRGAVHCGGKLWIFYRESKDALLSSRDVFLDDGFRLDRFVPPAKYGLEAIYLSKGDFFLMRANQPHAVYGKEPTIIHGGHFYLTSMMEVTAQSLFHSFVMDRYLTNTTHHRSRMLLRRIVDFYRMALLEKRYVDPDARAHLPAHDTFPGLINLLSLCNLVFMGNALDFRTYSAPNQKADDPATPKQKALMEQYDRNNIPKQERVSMMHARGIALELINWVRDFCIVTSPSGQIVADLPTEYICRQMSALLAYKKKVEEDGDILGAPHCTFKMLEKQIDNALACDEHMKKCWATRSKTVGGQELGFGSQAGYSICWKEGIPVLKTYEQLLRDGTTALDRLYLEGEAYRFQQDEDMALDDFAATVDVPMDTADDLIHPAKHSQVNADGSRSADDADDEEGDEAEEGDHASDDDEADEDYGRAPKRVRSK